VSEVPAIERVQTWCLDNPAGDLRVSALREIAGMSERDFSRKFRQETGQTVTGYVTNVRMDAACRLLSESRMPMKVVAGRSGFGSTASLRRAFLERFGVTPARYRENFGDWSAIV
jgi:transcriptional regulator GlxA family with amidase domain